ncbi:hypothetical protein BH09GEM1_BH09GEM1_46080 [soil metagenome]
MPPSSDPVEVTARADLAAGRWRKARDAFKELLKRDRATFQPLLVEANVGLARSMLAKELISDARQVLTYLRTIAPPATIAALEAEITAHAARSPKAAPDSVAQLLDFTLAPADRRAIADQLVVAFSKSDMESTTAERQQAVSDLRAIHQAIEFACLGNHDGALDLVRPLGRDSAFAHWRLFVRAVVAFQRGDDDKAAQYFEALPPDSVPGRAGIAWRLALVKHVSMEREASSEAVIEATGTLTGEPGWGRPLARAEVLWRAGKHAAAYRAVREAKPSFPSDGADFSAVLSTFFFNGIFALPEGARDAYADALWDIEENRRAKGPAELMMIRRTLSLLMAAEGIDDLESGALSGIWEAFLRDQQRVHGQNPRLASVGWCWLGQILARSRPQLPLHGRRAKNDNADAAITALEKSIALDAGNAEAHLLLASAYSTAAHMRDRNRVHDLMSERFPDNKQVLLAVGAGCIDRKTYSKAVECYQSAVLLDRLDPATPDLFVTACLLLAVQHYQKGKLPAARQTLSRTDDFAVDSAETLVRGRWTLAARRGVLEMMYGDATVGAAALDEARASSPSPAACLLFARLAWSFYYAPSLRRSFPAPLKTELAQEAKRQPTVRDAAILVQLWKYFATNGSSRARTMDEEAWLRRYLKGAARAPMAREDAARLLELLRAFPEFGQEGKSIASQMLKGDPKDPLFRLYRERLQPFSRLKHADLDSIRAEARRRGDKSAEQLAHELSGDFGGLGASYAEPWDDGEMLDEFDDGDERIASALGSPEAIAFMELLASAPAEEIPNLRKRRPQGMPAHLFDLLLMFARVGSAGPDFGVPVGKAPGKKPRPGKPRREKPQPAKPEPPPQVAPSIKPPPEPDPAQVDLF